MSLAEPAVAAPSRQRHPSRRGMPGPLRPPSGRQRSPAVAKHAPTSSAKSVGCVVDVSIGARCDAKSPGGGEFNWAAEIGDDALAHCAEPVLLFKSGLGMSVKRREHVTSRSEKAPRHSALGDRLAGESRQIGLACGAREGLAVLGVLYDAGKKVNGREIHALVDTQGLVRPS